MDHPERPARAGEESQEEYCRFGKRNLDGMSWLYPLVNNRLGDLLNVELRHEHLFFIQGDRIGENIGYSEKGQRFHEEDYGKELKTLADLKPNGYWLEGRRYDPGCMREALDQIDDGAYYSVLSNQCQDWTDRLKRAAGRIERERGIKLPAEEGSHRRERHDRLQARSGTAPAAWYLGAITLFVGGLSLLAPLAAANLYLLFLAALLIVLGLADIRYAIHAGPRPGSSATVFHGLVKVVFGGVLLVSHLAGFDWAWILPGAALLTLGLLKLSTALFSRPRVAWAATAGAGILEVAGGVLIINAGRTADARLVGVLLGVSLLAAGVSTLTLDWRLRQVSPQ